ncbi:MAG: hypothetical protein ACREBI_10900, partial [Nitrosotalea sp.]
TYNSTWLYMATKYLKWVYITDQTEPNPYAVFPSYFDQYLTDLSSLARPASLPATPEFGSLATTIFVISIVAMILITMKLNILYNHR